MKDLVTLLFIALIFVCPCTGYRDHSPIKAKVGKFVQTAPWKPGGWRANMNGSMLISIMQKYRVPLQSTLTGNGYIHHFKRRSCSQIKDKDKMHSDGVYTIYPFGTTGIDAYCDMTTDGGGWTVFQRRYNGETNFTRDWKSYKDGFGDPKEEYWLGNKFVHKLTMNDTCTLRIDMVTRKGEVGYAVYQNFSLGSEKEAYILRLGKYSGTAGENGGRGFSYHNGFKFSTADSDNDIYEKNCASLFESGFWYSKCYVVNLNAVYGSSNFYWSLWKQTRSAGYLKQTKMMLKC